MSAKDDRIIDTAFEQAADAMMITDSAEQILRVNRAFTRLTGFESAEVVGQMPSILRSGKNPKHLFADMWAALNGGGNWRGEIFNRKKSGRLFVADMTITAVVDHHGKAPYYFAVFHDVTAAKEAELKRLLRETRDPQTFLLNRAAFFERLAQLCAPRNMTDSRAALLLIDFDRFRAVNDEHGTAAGDLVLMEAARRLRKCLRDGDTLGRLSGDEFAVILPDLEDNADILKVTSKIHEKLMNSYDLANGHRVDLSCSIGVIIVPAPETSVDFILRQANHLLHAAKIAGGGRWRAAESGAPPRADAAE